MSSENPSGPGPVAILEIGSTGIRLLIAEISAGRKWKVLDQAGRPVALGKDVFTSGEVSRESLLECLLVLRNYQELIATWGIREENVRVIATSAVRAARNRDIFVDRVRHETGFLLNIVEGLEENRLMYLAVRYALKNDLPLFRRGNAMIIDVGGGSTEIMLLRRGKMVSAHSLRLGTIRIGQQFRLTADALKSRARYLKDSVRNTVEFLSAEMDLSRVSVVVIAGSDARFLAARRGKELNRDCWTLEREDYLRFVEEIRDYSPEDCVRNLQIPYADADGFVPGNLVYRFFLERTSASSVAVPNLSIREGLIIDMAQGVDPELEEDFFSQIIASAVNLGRKYRFDEAHNLHVAMLCMALFDALAKEHGMNRRERMMLEAAASIHDIGSFIKGSGHHRHGQYIVVNSEIFGLHREELEIIGNVIRYHRGSPPSESDINYIALDREDRILVLKMASLLRLADALDRGHTQHIQSIRVERRNKTILIHTEGNLDLSSERLGLAEKADVFQDVFGYTVILV
ncbi:MAG: HD domain-containing protein [Spirochaetaceae bacterium]|jgi:exopolyphosphatase/guanosine-5'-triphosphate,3'-diphosphate pyrophosphatase|nr:HD domain-containing protein [Spirochaetaceae bacterium]